jgi:uncharacterized membrane-anchored protein YjiN (DUF445 family)
VPSERVKQLKAELLDNRRVRQHLAGLWDKLSILLHRVAKDPSSTLRDALAGALPTLGELLGHAPSMQARVNDWIAEAVQADALPWRREIGGFATNVVQRWDARTARNLMELAVGRDLQYIGVNGTVVGALVGYVLF